MLTTTDAGSAAHDDVFFEPLLRFGIRKPPGWRFLPASWSPTTQMARLSSKADWARHARLPFVAMTRDIASDRQPRPTLQVTCRPAGRQGTAEIERLLELQFELLRRELDDFEPLAASFDRIVGGRRAAHVEYRYTLKLRLEGEMVATRVLARSDLVLSPGLAFVIAMSSSAEPLYYEEADFAFALASIRIGARDRGRLTLGADGARVIRWMAPPRKPS